MPLHQPERLQELPFQDPIGGVAGAGVGNQDNVPVKVQVLSIPAHDFTQAPLDTISDDGIAYLAADGQTYPCSSFTSSGGHDGHIRQPESLAIPKDSPEVGALQDTVSLGKGFPHHAKRLAALRRHRDCKPFPALPAPPAQNLSPVPGAHSSAKTVGSKSLDSAGLICPFHLSSCSNTHPGCPDGARCEYESSVDCACQVPHKTYPNNHKQPFLSRGFLTRPPRKRVSVVQEEATPHTRKGPRHNDETPRFGAGGENRTRTSTRDTGF